jgi:release factor glutamine methyltransferase
MSTVAQLLTDAAIAGDESRRDAEIFLGHCLDKPRSWLYTWPDAELDVVTITEFSRLMDARKKGCPVAYLIGRRGFWTLNLQVNQHTLIPRPETEMLVEWALELDLSPAAIVLDLGTGCGAIALALASEKPNWRIVGVDASEPALDVARRNAIELQLESVQFVQSNWYDAVPNEHFGLLISNPPYIEPGDVHLSQGDLRFEPTSALQAQDAGFADLMTLIEGAPAHISSGSYLLLEHGYQQGGRVRELLAQRGFMQIESRCDLAGQERVSGGCWNAQ